MTLNREVFATDPEKLELLNHGVAEVKGGRSDAELRTLRYELSTFVCKGQYEVGLLKVLEVYLSNLGKTEQPGAGAVARPSGRDARGPARARHAL